MSLPAPYERSDLPAEDRLSDLLGRMTLAEKVGQLLMLSAHEAPERSIREKNPGAMLNVLSTAGRAIGLALETRLRIPLLVAEDCIHGHSFWKDATIFPTQLALGCTWNPDLLGEIARAAAREISATGVHWTFSPVLCVARDLRWGRVGETFGEDLHLIERLALAMIRGYQGESLSDPSAVLATAKHFAGYSETQGGRDSSEADLSRRKLRAFFLPPFEAAARARCRTFMTGYQAIDGVPIAANRWLLREVLKDEWGYEGILVTDWDTVGAMVRGQRVCADLGEAAVRAVRAGHDMIMATPEAFDALIAAVADGRLSEAEIDGPCRRILRLKFAMGLFENPRFPDEMRRREVIACLAHRELNRKAARQSVVLLRNDGVLPLRAERIRRIAVIGPNADDDRNQLGDWSLGCPLHGGDVRHSRSSTCTVWDGLRATAPVGCEVRYAPGCAIGEGGSALAGEAVALAEGSDVIVAVVGDALEFVGERHSTATLELQGGQIDLLGRLSETGVPLVVVLVNSKPLVLPETVTRAAAILEAFNPGMEGGTAIAEILWGEVNPSGKLCVSFARHVGQQPVYYNQVRGQHGKRYADLTQEPLFAFGFGLSYTRFVYANLRVANPEVLGGAPACLTVEVTNAGDRAGEDIVQVYVSDQVTSVSWVERELKAFRRVSLAPGEKAEVTFEIPREAFSLVNADGVRVVEPGVFEILVGPSSRTEDLLQATVMIR